MVADNKMVTAAVVISIIITYLVFHKFLDWESSILSCIRYIYIYFIFLISRLRCIGIVKLRLRSANIRLLFPIRSDDLVSNVVLCVGGGM